MMQNIDYLKDSSEENSFSGILKKENNFLRLPRQEFIDFSKFKESLSIFSFAKEQIERWNYEEALEAILKEKVDLVQSKYEEVAVKAMMADVKQLLSECFSLSEKYRPAEVSMSVVKSVPCTKLHADFLPFRDCCIPCRCI